MLHKATLLLCTHRHPFHEVIPHGLRLLWGDGPEGLGDFPTQVSNINREATVVNFVPHITPLNFKKLFLE